MKQPNYEPDADPDIINASISFERKVRIFFPGSRYLWATYLFNIL